MALKRASEVGDTPTETGDPFRDQRIAWSAAIENNRDQWGRPKVKRPDGAKDAGKETGYRRASSYGSPLENDSNLIKWKLRQVARGTSHSRAIRLAVTRAETGLDSDNKAEAKAAKKKLNELCEQAMDEVGSGDQASIGTSMHHVHELHDRGLPLGHVPEEFTADVAAWVDLTRYFRMVSIERFVVQDDHKVAGTLDRAAEVLLPLVLASGTVLRVGDVVILDEKTAQAMDFAGVKFAVQSWVYATGEPYDPVLKTRVPWGHAAPRTDVALIAHVPSGHGKAALFEIDLVEAAEAAEAARKVYEWRNSRGKKTVAATTSHVGMLAELQSATDEAPDLPALKGLARQANGLGVWCPEVAAIFTARREALEAAAPVAVPA